MRRSGHTLLEVLISVSLLAVIVLSTYALVQREQSFSRAVLEVSHVERTSQEMLYGLERELANASGANPAVHAPQGLAAGATTLLVQSTLGFPPSGLLVIDRGQANEERVRYGGLEAGKVLFLDVERGAGCSADVAHAPLAEVMWAGLAEPLAQQSPPPAGSAYDGLTLEDHGPVYYRGDGTGFSYRIPIEDPATGLLKGNDLNWGASIQGAGDLATGWNALYFAPKTTFDEAADGHDVNGDGDAEDVFDVGQIRKVSWDVADPTVSSDVGLGPSNVLQERCGRGSDLDGDGYDDPIFLWDRETNELHVRLFVIGVSQQGVPVTRKVESVMFLRNEPEL